ncbi:uncharacterized protein BDZ99DRAFT_457997 [Mytilinidion resinicola]|uniref:NACHT domain-containing protein n=1 Tax=Mytilinidion resinicola TaxID=574789 RepID=A0A6A6Z759_9PEZI|nr:uncharacterized protein BDZ99DRAFT_457997 [Mytilinidion resinicola]KAF2816085.1 hypothetical protein BDZ99DRAFT_457997 [Mytilinidion resinicola]
MKDTVSNAGTGVSLDDAERACTAILNCVDVSGYESNLDQHASGTLQWVSSDPQYNNWLSKDSMRLLWVTGFSGCGKTILSHYLVVHLQKMLSPSTIICRFFCNGRIESQRDSVNLLRSIIYQIVMHRRKLLRIVRRASDAQGFQLFSRFDSLWNPFLEICRHKGDELIVIIDAIDECEEQIQVSMTKRIVNLLGSEPEFSIKFLITSRPNVPATYVLKSAAIQCIRLKLEEKQSQ